MNHPQQDDPVQQGELDCYLGLCMHPDNPENGVCWYNDTYKRLKSEEWDIDVVDRRMDLEAKAALNRLITREAIRLCNAVIGEDESANYDLQTNLNIVMLNNLKAQQRQRLADLVKGHYENESAKSSN